MTDTPDLVPIGRFSSLSRISVRMLRHYDTHGVLVPADVDAVTGYRRYAPAQLGDAAMIRRLRDVGFGVSVIGALLAIRGTTAFDEALRAQRLDLVAAAEDAAARLRLIDTVIREPIMTDTVSLTTLPARMLVRLRGTVPDYAGEGRLWERFLPALQAQGITPTGPGGCIEHDDEFRETDVDESVFFEVLAGTAAAAPLTVVDAPSTRAVEAVVEGPYAEAIPRAHELIGAYVAEHGLTLARTVDDPATHHFNVYLNDPRAVPEAEVRTRVVVPVR